MKEEDIFEEIIDIGKRRGKLTYEEINDAVPSEYFSPDELEDLIDLLQDIGVEVIDDQELGIVEEAVLDGKEEEDLNNSEEEKKDEALEMSLKIIDNLMIGIETADRKIARYGTLKDLGKLINEKNKQGINPIKLNTLAKEVRTEYKYV